MFEYLPETGLLFLLYAAILALFSCGLALYTRNQTHVFYRGLPCIVCLICSLTIGSIIILSYLFAADNFSVVYVAQHSSRMLPLIYKTTAIWSGHEGSLLVWLGILSFWSFCLSRQPIPSPFQAHTLIILLLLYTIFAFFILCYANPFIRLSPVPLNGRDLNPMLQDYAFVLHPLFLYLGYAGLAVPFALSMTMMLHKKIPAILTTLMIFWVRVAWLFLTAGIVTGAYWAYYELGWGGFWFWDPVENVSLFPWLLTTALLHMLHIHKQRGHFSYWIIFLGLAAFSASILGFFIVRSGIIASVHAFAIDSSRGLALLVMLMLITASAFIPFAIRINQLTPVCTQNSSPPEWAVLGLTMILMFMFSALCIGTFYPLALNLFFQQPVSIGAPYFNRFFLISSIFLLLLLSGLPKLFDHKIRITGLIISGGIALLSTALLFVFYHLSFQWRPGFLLFLCFFALVNHLMLLMNKQSRNRYLWMSLAHIGLLISFLGGTLGQFYHHERHLLLTRNQETPFLNFILRLDDTRHRIDHNFTAHQTYLQVFDQNHQLLTTLTPEKRYYATRNIEMSEVSLYRHYLSDLYVLFGEKRSDDQYTFKLQYKPLINLLWFGLCLMIVSCALQYRFKKQNIQ